MAQLFPIRIVPEEALTVDFLGMVVNVKAVPLDKEIFGTIWPVAVFKAAVMLPAAIDFVPSALWETVVVPVAICQLEFRLMSFGVCEE